MHVLRLAKDDDCRVRALQSTDKAHVHALLDRHFAGTRYHARFSEQLDEALAGRDVECAGLTHDDANGVLVYGAVAGSPGVLKIHAAIGDGLGALVQAFLVLEAGRSARMIICETADDAPTQSFVHLLLTFGFLREGRIEDFFGDGIALDILTLRR